MLVIGYQGEVGSNAEQAAHEMAKNLEFTEVLYKPLVSSHNVIRELTTGKIDYGVVAIKNNLGGRVEETFNAIKDEPLELVDTTILTIHHCLFKKRGVDDSELAFISSHIQALLQTQQSREKLYPHLVEKEVPDTAFTAQWLAEGRLDKNVAVLCKKSAGNDNNLELIRENLEDKLSQTEFRMYKLSNIDYDNAQKPSIFGGTYQSYVRTV